MTATPAAPSLAPQRTRRSDGGGRGPRRARWDKSAILFVAPALLLALAFLIVPMVGAFVYSTAQIATLSGRVTWVGFENYATMFADPTFFRSLLNTALFIVLTVPLSMAVGLALAVLMNSVLPGRKVFRTLIYLPLVISGVAVGIIGTFFFNETIGVLELDLLGRAPAIPWQSNGACRLRLGGAVTLWIRVGFTMIIYLAGLQGVPVELYEAGAGRGRGRLAALPLHHPAAARTGDVLPADHERDLLLPGVRHRLRADQRRARRVHRGAGHVRVQDRLRGGARPGLRLPPSGW